MTKSPKSIVEMNLVMTSKLITSLLCQYKNTDSERSFQVSAGIKEHFEEQAKFIDNFNKINVKLIPKCMLKWKVKMYICNKVYMSLQLCSAGMNSLWLYHRTYTHTTELNLCIVPNSLLEGMVHKSHRWSTHFHNSFLLKKIVVSPLHLQFLFSLKYCSYIIL